MKYRNEGINKKKKNINFILIYSFVAFISISILFIINIDNRINVLTKEIPLLNTKLNNIENSIISENKNRNDWKRFNSIKKTVEKKGMISANESNIIQVWWNKENN
tara:strand:+ start:1504 stop:1821 length:318 start_codon:yes stop_codon:yes gene_type:complete